MTINLHTFIEGIKQKPNPDEIEIELKLLFDKQYVGAGKLVDKTISKADAKYLFRAIFEELANSYKLREQQSVNLISKDGINKQILYSAGIKVADSRSIYSKTRICEYYLTNERYTWKIKACREHQLSTFDDRRTNYNIIRFKRRFSAALSQDWRVDYTFIIQLPYNSQESAIRDARERLFLIEEYRVYDAADSVEVEIEYTNSPRDITAKSIDDALSLFPKINLHNSDMYECAIARLKHMFSERIVRGDRRLSIKQLLPQTATLTKKQYLHIVIDQERAADFYISHKLDGERVILFLGTKFSDGKNNTQIEHSGYLTTEKWYPLIRQTENTEKSMKCDNNLEFSAILDCELYAEKLYVFDILEYTGADITNAIFAADTREKLPLYMSPYLVRRKCIAQLQSTLESLQFMTAESKYKSSTMSQPCIISIRIKPSIKLGALYQSAIQSLLQEKTDYPRDGIIFTSARDPYLTTEYYKWKPPCNMTIEFIAKKCPIEILGTPPYSRRRGKTLYLLYVGIRSEIARAFGLRRLPHYHALFPMLQRRDYFPIHFAPSSAPLAYLYWDECADLDNQIVELIRDIKTDSWQLIKTRQDRQADYMNSQYFGNDYYVAESIWNSYHNPFSTTILTKSPPELKREFYFVEDDATDFRATRKFNNWVKTKLLELCGKQHWLLDLGAGKGQDFMKYLQMNIANVIFADANSNNIDEIIARKHLYFKQGLFRHTTMATHTICCDVMAPPFLEQVAQFTPYCKLIVCNFAIHYMCYNEDTAKTFATKIAAILPAGGRFLITYLDGRKVFNKLNAAMRNDESDEQTTPEWIADKYHIRAGFVDSHFTGRDQLIHIKLPFSQGFYSEYLFDPALLTKALRAYKITPELSGEFSEFVAQFQTEKNNYTFNAADIEYIGLLGYTIYHK